MDVIETVVELVRLTEPDVLAETVFEAVTVVLNDCEVDEDKVEL